jgi:hypothetical protein
MLVKLVRRSDNIHRQPADFHLTEQGLYLRKGFMVPNEYMHMIRKKMKGAK